MFRQVWLLITLLVATVAIALLIQFLSRSDAGGSSTDHERQATQYGQSAPQTRPVSATRSPSVTSITTKISSDRQPAKPGEPIAIGNLDSLVPGDEISIYVPQEAATWTGRVQTTETTRAGNQIITGHIDDRRFLFTVGQKQTFGTFYTPNDGYQISAQNGLGRVVAQSAIRKRLDYSEPDFVIRTPNRNAGGSP